MFVVRRHLEPLTFCMRTIGRASFLILLFVATSGAGEDRLPAAKVTVGRDTTYFDGPLDEFGDVDYERAINERMRGKTVPERNVMALLIQAVGPKPNFLEELPSEYFKWLGVPEPPKEGNYFVSLRKFTPDGQKVPIAVLAQQELAWSKPWKETEYPRVAEWLTAIDKPLDLVVAATRRDQFYNPLAVRVLKGERNGLGTVVVPQVRVTEELSRALAVRAMLRLGQGRPDDAWNDLLAAHRLTRHIARGGLLQEHFNGTYGWRVLFQADQAYLENSRLSARQLRNRLSDLQALPPFDLATSKVDLAERSKLLDMMRLMRRQQWDVLASCLHLATFLQQKVPPLTDDQKKRLSQIDWNEVQRLENEWCDKIVAILRIPDRQERSKAIFALRMKINALTGSPEYENVVGWLLGDEPDKKPTQILADRAVHFLLIASVHSAQLMLDHAEQYARNQQIAYALVIYHRDHKRFPETLNELVPGYLQAVPLDMYSGKLPVYKPQGTEGFIVYAIGNDQRDEGGRGMTEASGDDVSFRIERLKSGPRR